MAKSGIKIAVKVGNSSYIRFKNCISLRAITLSELVEINSKNKLSLIVIEHISADEVEQATALIKELMSKGVEVFIYSPENDDNTCGVADELELDIYMSLSTLHVAIFNKVGLNLSTAIDASKIGIHENSILEQIESLNDMNQFDGAVPLQGQIQQIIGQPVQIIQGAQTFQDGQHVQPVQPMQPVQAVMGAVGQLVVLETSNNNIENNMDSNSIEQINTLKSQVELLSEINTSLEDAVATYKDMLDDIDKDQTIIEEPIPLAEYSLLQEELSSIKETLDNKQAEINGLETQLEAERKKADSSEESRESIAETLTLINAEFEALKTRAESLETSVAKLNIQVDTVTKNRNTLIKLFRASTDKIESLSVINSGLVLKLDTLRESSVFSEDSNAKKIQLLEKSNLELNKQLSEQKESLGLKIATLEQNISIGNAPLAELKSKLAQTEESLRAKEKLLAAKGQSDLLSKASSSSNTALEVVNKGLQDTVTTLKAEIAQYKISQLSFDTKLNEEKLKVIAAKTESLQKGTTSSYYNQNGVQCDCTYSAKAKIINVYGSGSFGVTTLAFSLAQRLVNNGKVIILDFDFVSPKVASWVGEVPLLQSLPQITDMSKRSAVGALLELGADYVVSNLSSVIIEKKMNNVSNKKLSFFSNYFSKINPSTVTSTNFSHFFESIGEIYDYIVIDCGKLGSNDVSDGVIKMVHSIAHRNIVVTTKDKFDTRDMASKMMLNGLSKSSVLWVMNMTPNTQFDSTSVKSTEGSLMLSSIPLAEDICSSKLPYDKEKKTKGNFENLVKEVLKA